MSVLPAAYETIGKRTFRQALIHLFETDYKIMGSHRVLEMMATDIVALMETYHPQCERLKSGDLVWTTTARSEQKPGKGKRTEEYEQVTLALPWVTADEIRSSPTERHSVHQRDVARAVRVIKAAYAAGGLLTQAEVGLLFNTAPAAVGDWLNEHYQRTGEVLPTKGQALDMGCQPSHKDIVIYLYEQKLDAAEIARRTAHHQLSVDRYIQDYERVKLLLGKGIPPEEIGHAIGRALSTVKQYCKLVLHYHPELRQTPTTDPASTATKI
jgi:hypothetical protein